MPGLCFRSSVLALIAVLALCCGVGAGSISDAVLSADGAQVTVSGVASGSFSGFFYVQQADRSRGLRVAWQGPMERGSTVTAAGVMTTNGHGERVLQASSAVAAPGDPPVPLHLIGRAAGGSDFFHDPETGAGQQGTSGGTGLNNIGLLAQSWGRVKWVSQGLWVLDDGSGADSGEGIPGLRIHAPNLLPPPDGLRVKISGIVSCVRLNGSLYPVLMPRDQQDVHIPGGVISGHVTRDQTWENTISVGSPHPCPDNFARIYRIEGPPTAQRMRVHFSLVDLDVFDAVTLSDHFGNVRQEISYFNTTFPVADFWSSWVPGNIIDIGIQTDELYFLLERYGFQVDRVEVMEPGIPVASVALTISPGSDTVYTDDEGFYAFTDLAEGLYRVTPHGGDFVPPFQDAYIVEGEYQQSVDFTKL